MTDSTTTAVNSGTIISTRVHPAHIEHLVSIVESRRSRHSGGYVCFCTVYNVMLALESEGYQAALNESTYTVPDGMPLVWMLRWLGIQKAERLYGPDSMLKLMEFAEANAWNVGLFGGSQETLDRLTRRMTTDFPDATIVYAYSPPFRPLSSDEERQIRLDIERSQCDMLFVGIGTPKQEYWMQRNAGGLTSVLFGVGAAFDFLSGAKPQAPRWMMNFGLEWLFRLVSEPSRLWRRYLYYNPRFIFMCLTQLLRAKRVISGRAI